MQFRQRTWSVAIVRFPRGTRACRVCIGCREVYAHNCLDVPIARRDWRVMRLPRVFIVAAEAEADWALRLEVTILRRANNSRDGGKP